MNFVAGTQNCTVGHAIVAVVVADPVATVADGIGLATVAVAEFVNVGSGLAAKNCLGIRPEGNLIVVPQKQKSLQITITVLT